MPDASGSNLESPESGSLPYAAQRSAGISQSWAATLLVFSGLTLIGLGGCFLIGVMMLLSGQFFWGMYPIVWTPAVYALLLLLFALALACFIGAVAILPAGIRGLLRIVSGK